MDHLNSGSLLHALLGEKPVFAKDEGPHHFREQYKDSIVYEDDDVIVVDQGNIEHEDGSSKDVWEKRLLLAPKKRVESLLDLDVADGALAVAILRGIQKAALKVGLEKHGFEVSLHVLPPLQRSNLLKIKIRSGEKQTKKTK